jgi:uncharacterized protein YdaU (DUF1376 family)
MSERPFMQLYVSDFVGDTLTLTTEHIGAYLLLLIALWNANGVLPSEERKLARVARLTPTRWRRIAVDLLPFFDIDGDRLTHYRLTKELQKSLEKSQERAAAGSLGGKANALKYNKPRAAKAPVLLKHLPESISKKKTNPILEEKGGAAPVRLDRYADEPLFKACEALSGVTVPSYQQFKSFPPEMVVEARRRVCPPGPNTTLGAPARPPPSPAGVPPL